MYVTLTCRLKFGNRSITFRVGTFRRGQSLGAFAPPGLQAGSAVREPPEVARDKVEFYALSDESYFEEIGPWVKKLQTFVRPGFNYEHSAMAQRLLGTGSQW